MSASLPTEKSGELNVSTVPYTANRSLIRHGCVMTLLGLVSGLTPGLVKAPTAALEAHTIGVLQGALLFGLAAIWPSLSGFPRLVRVAKYLCVDWTVRQLDRFAIGGFLEYAGAFQCHRALDAGGSHALDGGCGCYAAIALVPHNCDVRADFHRGARACENNKIGNLKWADDR